MILEGTVHVFGDNINTDDIIAAKYLDSQDEKFLGSKCMENIDTHFASKVRPGDIIVAGANFGCGSSREHAPLAIKGCGVTVVIAVSFARIFYRNSINVGLPILACSSAKAVQQGNILSVDLQQGIIKNITTKKVYHSEKFPSFMQAIIDSKGLLNWIKSK